MSKTHPDPNPPQITTITVHFADLPDPRRDRTKHHELLDILTIAICAAICGAEGWDQIAMFGQCKEAWFSSSLSLRAEGLTFLKLTNGIPSHDTPGRVVLLMVGP